MTVSIIKLYEILKPKLGEQGAEDLTQYIEQKITTEVAGQSTALATKEDLALVRRDVSESKADVIKWMFIFWAGQLAALFGLLKYFMDK